MAEMIKIILREPIIKVDEFGHWLHVSLPAFKKNPKKVYKVPNSTFWKREAVLEKGRYYLAQGNLDFQEEVIPAVKNPPKNNKAKTEEKVEVTEDNNEVKN